MTWTLDEEYLGWREVSHASHCRKPQWIVDVRREEAALPRGGRYDDTHHSCPNEDCEHADRDDQQTVRLLCKGCRYVLTFKGIAMSEGGRGTDRPGYGQPPTRIAGLWVWPGRALLDDLREPWEAYVTETEQARLREEDIVGLIGQGRGARGAMHWWAAAVRDPNPRWSKVAFTVRTDRVLKTKSAAVKWISTQLAVERERLRLEGAGSPEATSRSTTSSITP